MAKKKQANAEQVRYHLALMDAFPCACGCGRASTIVHHPLDEHPEQGTRRNHEYVVPMADIPCHRALHQQFGSDHGGENSFQPGRSYAELAYSYRQWGLDCGHLRETVNA